jgi:hypothetical protein
VGTVTQLFQVGSSVYLALTPAPGQFTDSCSSGRTLLWFTIDITTDAGKSYLALAEGAKLTGGQVWVGGNGVCTTAGTPNGVYGEGIQSLASE